jgi:hypothetical protein
MRNVFNKKSLVACIGLIIAGTSFAAEKVEPQDPKAEQDPSVVQKEPDAETGKKSYEIKGAGISAELSPEEYELIQRKREVLKKRVYEDQQLDDLRDMLRDSSRQENYDKTKDEEYPLSSDQIVQLRKIQTEVKRAKNAPLKDLKLDITSEELDVDVNNPIVLRVARGYNATLVFFDQSGSPWPVEGDVLHNKSSFASKVVSKTKHIVSFDISEDFSESTAMITLEGHAVPIIVKLVGSDTVVDSRKSIRVLKYGPNAQVEPFVHNELENVSPEMLSILEGANIPAGAKRYVLNGVSGEAYLYSGDLYVRTRAMLMSPPWKQSAVSNSGYRIYKMKPSSVLMFSNNGERQEATVENSYEAEIKYKKTIFEN